MNEPGEVLKKVLRNRKDESGIELKRSIELINVDKDEVEKDSVAVANSASPNPFG